MSTPDGRLHEGPHRVVVVGGGFGGLQAVRRLRALSVSITLIDRRSFHLFQPLVYQVATGMLSAGEIGDARLITGSEVSPAARTRELIHS